MLYGKPVTENKKFKDDDVKTVYRHWLCPKDGCDGEMVGTGHGMSTNRTHWQHRCDKCGYEEWATRSYPDIVHIVPDAFGQSQKTEK
jgi:hypothetical protein